MGRYFDEDIDSSLAGVYDLEKQRSFRKDEDNEAEIISEIATTKRFKERRKLPSKQG